MKRIRLLTLLLVLIMSLTINSTKDQFDLSNEVSIEIDQPKLRSNLRLDVSIASPLNISYIFGETGNTLQWSVSDVTPTTYRYRLFSGGTFTAWSLDIGWVSDIPITVNVDGLGVGSNFIQIEFSGSEVVLDTVYIDVLADINPPLVDFYSNVSQNFIHEDFTTDKQLVLGDNIEYNEGSTGNTIYLNVTDLNDGTFRHRTQSSGIFTQWTTSTAWVYGVQIPINIDGLALGDHLIQIELSDGVGNLELLSINIKVIDFEPLLSSPDDIVMTLGELNVDPIVWRVFDTNVELYGSKLDNGGWITQRTNIPYGLGFPFFPSDMGLDLGLHILSFLLMDTSGSIIIDTVEILVVEGIAPVFVNQPQNYTYTENVKNNTLSWTLTDNNPGYYRYQIDNDWSASIAWQSNVSFSISIDGLSTGSHTLTLEVSDVDGLTVTDTVMITVYDATVPITTVISNNTITETIEAIITNTELIISTEIITIEGENLTSTETSTYTPDPVTSVSTVEQTPVLGIIGGLIAVIGLSLMLRRKY